MEIAKTILNQLGGNKFAFATGSKNFVSDNKSLTFKLSMNRSKGRYMKITLNGNDLYDIKVLNLKGKVIVEKNDICVENLQYTFTEITGLIINIF